MKNRKPLFLWLLVGTISGCAMSPSEFNPGSDRKKFNQDEYECERDARSAHGNSCDQMGLYEKCLRSKGYEEIKGSAKRGLCAEVF